MEADSTEHVAFPLAADSYNSMLQRYEAIHGRIQHAMSLIVTVFFLSVALAKSVNSDLSLMSPLFFAASVMFLVAMLIGSFVLYGGVWETLNLKVAHPRATYEAIGYAPTEFRRYILDRAVRSFEHNCKVILYKARIAGLLVLILVAMVFCLAFWVFGA